MPNQLEFWITEEPRPPASSQWEDLDVEQRAALITMLARMISKAAHPQWIHEEDQNNER